MILTDTFEPIGVAAQRLLDKLMDRDRVGESGIACPAPVFSNSLVTISGPDFWDAIERLWKARRWSNSSIHDAFNEC